jgi:hypothetical protein
MHCATLSISPTHVLEAGEHPPAQPRGEHMQGWVTMQHPPPGYHDWKCQGPRRDPCRQTFKSLPAGVPLVCSPTLRFTRKRQSNFAMTYLPTLIKGTQSFELPVGKHTVSVSVVVSQFDLDGKAHLKSWTRCQPCCNDAPNPSELDPFINDLHVKAFGLGGWVYTKYVFRTPLGSFNTNK